MGTNVQSASDQGTHAGEQMRAQKYSVAQTHPDLSIMIPQRSLEQRGAVTPARDSAHK